MNRTEEPIEATIEGHEAPIRTPKQLIITVILAFVIPITIIAMLISYVASGTRVGAGSDALSEEAIAKRIQPVAQFKLVDANAPKVFKTGKEVFESTCAACHTTGVAGAPKIGDEGAWAPYIKTGLDEMVKNAIHGVGAMPPKGGNASLSDFEVERTVVYIANQSGASFDEPEPPAEEAGAQAAPATQAAAAPAPEAVKAAQPASTEAGAAQPAASSTPQIDPAGEKLYKSVCFACHDTGAANAPKFGDKAAWDPYIKTGLDEMVKNAIHGVGAMPPRGGSQASDAEVRAAVEYIVHDVAPEALQGAAAPAQPAEEEAAKPAETAAAGNNGQAAAANGQQQAQAEIDPAGEKLYKSVCFACHDTGAAGAPKLGDKTAWDPYIKTGLDEMVKNAIHGVGAMPPRGGSQASDAEVRAAVEYIVHKTEG